MKKVTQTSAYSILNALIVITSALSAIVLLYHTEFKKSYLAAGFSLSMSCALIKNNSIARIVELSMKLFLGGVIMWFAIEAALS